MRGQYSSHLTSCFPQVKKSYLELPENAKVKKVWEIIDQYQVKKTKDLDWEGELAE